MYTVSITIPDLDTPTPEEAAQAARRFLASEVMLHDLQFEVRGQRTSPMQRRSATEAVTLKGHDIELPSMLVLSTAHVTRETARLLEDDEAGIVRHEKGEYGWIIPIIEEPDFQPPPNLPDLVGLFAFAASLGARWIMLDRDADQVEGLPTWEW